MVIDPNEDFEPTLKDIYVLMQAQNVTLLRIYDTLGLLAHQKSSSQWRKLQEHHNNGSLFLTPPWLNEDPFELGEEDAE